jgi:quinol monooxygenase YgiN
MPSTIRVVARIPVRPDKIVEARAILEGFVAPTRKEAGCITYELLQNRHDPTDFTFVEEWESEAALDAHSRSPHIQAGRKLLPDLLTGETQIHRYDLIA